MASEKTDKITEKNSKKLANSPNLDEGQQLDYHMGRASGHTMPRQVNFFCILGGSMGDVQCPPSIKNKVVKTKNTLENHQGEGAPLYKAGPPTSPGSQTPPHLQNKNGQKLL